MPLILILIGMIGLAIVFPPIILLYLIFFGFGWLEITDKRR